MRAYFIGIGGIGMSSLAQYLKAQKWVVSGSDAVRQPILAKLKKVGIRAKISPQKASLPRGLDLVVISQAIPADNPELKAARRRGIRVLTYPEAITELTEEYRTVAVAGAHGKSTTTALAALAMMRGGMDPTVIVGAAIPEFGDRNFRAGGLRGGWLALEADEFGNAFARYSPFAAVVTNIDREHLDVFGNLAGVKKAFLGFMGNIRSGGFLILNGDDPHLRALRPKIAILAKRKGAKVVWYSAKGAAARKIRRAIKIPGAHNVSNAAAVLALGRALGIPEKKTLAAIGSYRGARRRMEYRGMIGGRNGAPVYDDYGHHPAEIRATLSAFREKYPRKRILCVFQPHQIKRLNALFGDFMTAFAGADAVLILPVYKVNGRDGGGSGRGGRARDSEALARAIQRREPSKRLFYLADARALGPAIRTLADPLSEWVIVMMGAGDIFELTGNLLFAAARTAGYHGANPRYVRRI